MPRNFRPFISNPTIPYRRAGLFVPRKMVQRRRVLKAFKRLRTQQWKADRMAQQ